MKTIFGLFEDFLDARMAVEELREKNFEPGEMSLLATKATVRNNLDPFQGRERPDQIGESGELADNRLDDLFAFQEEFEISDLGGEVYASGDLANVLSETASDAGGSLRAGLAHFDLGDDTVNTYGEGIKGGGILFFMRAFDDHTDEAIQILQEHNAKRVTSHTPLQQ